MIVFKNDLFEEWSFLKTRRLDNDRSLAIFNDYPSLTIFNDEPSSTIVKDHPSLTIVYDDPSFTIVNEERKRTWREYVLIIEQFLRKKSFRSPGPQLFNFM